MKKPVQSHRRSVVKVTIKAVLPIDSSNEDTILKQAKIQRTLRTACNDLGVEITDWKSEFGYMMIKEHESEPTEDASELSDDEQAYD